MMNTGHRKKAATCGAGIARVGHRKVSASWLARHEMLDWYAVPGKPVDGGFTSAADGTN